MRCSSINQISPIFVNFAVPGAYVDRVRTAQAKGSPRGAGGRRTALTDDDRADNWRSSTMPSIRRRTRSSCARASPMPTKRCGRDSSSTSRSTLGTDANAVVVPDACGQGRAERQLCIRRQARQHAEQRSGRRVTRTVAGETVIDKGLDGRRERRHRWPVAPRRRRQVKVPTKPTRPAKRCRRRDFEHASTMNVSEIFVTPARS